MIKTIIFDFGDVFINLDKAATERGLKSLGLTHFSNDMLSMNESYEMGKVSSEVFMDFYLKQINHASKRDLLTAWNSILLDFPKHRLAFLQTLKQQKKYQLFLLSNTNEMHIDYVKEQFSFYDEFKSAFDKFYLSHEIGLRKPNTDIYEFVLNDNKLIPQECFFIDDTKDNTDSASQLGIQTWNINPKTDDITELFTKNPLAFD